MKETNTEINNFNIYDKLYKPKFNLGDIVCFVTDEDDDKKYLLYGYLIEITGNILYALTRNGDSITVQYFEIKKIV